MRYETDPEFDLERKLDLEPEVGAHFGDIIYLSQLRNEEASTSDEIFGKVSPNTYHELFSDPRLEDDEVLEIADQDIEGIQEVLDENRPAIGERPGYFFTKGYRNSGSELVEDLVTGRTTLEEFVEARKDPFRDTDYVHKDYEGPMSSVPGLGEFFHGREKKLSDKFYNAASGEVKQRIGETRVDVV